MAMVTKKATYEKHGIQYRDGKILSPIGWIPELLKVGNSKTGKNVWTWSILPTGRACFDIYCTDWTNWRK